jgi:hypothetical protein
MARLEQPPFGRGETFYQGGAIDANNLGGLNYEGAEFEFDDVIYNAAAGAKPARTNRKVLCQIVRNVSTIALLPSRLVTKQIAGTDGRFMEGRVDGYATTTAQPGAYPVDEYIPVSVPVNDLFWIVLHGPATVLVDIAGGANNVFTVGSFVVSLTAATSQATTAGRVVAQDLTGATAVLGNQLQNVVGRCLSAATTAQTTQGILIDVMQKW